MFDKLSLKDVTTNVKSLMEKVGGLVSAVDKIDKMLLRLLGSSLQNQSCADYAKKYVSKYLDKIIDVQEKTKQFPTSSFATLEALETVLATTENAAVLFVSFYFVF